MGTVAMLTDDSPEIREFMEAYEANQKISRRWCYDRVVAETRRKYILIDETTESGVSRSGRFMVDRETGYVYTILGYGKRGHLIGTSLGKMVAEYRAATASFDPRCRVSIQNRRSRLNRTSEGGAA